MAAGESAGKDLACMLARAGDRTGSLIIGVPKGGAFLGAHVALALGVEYECIPVCRVGVPGAASCALAAIDPDNIGKFDPRTQLTQYELLNSRGALAALMRAEVEMCRGDRTPVDLARRDVIVVDLAADTHLVGFAVADYLRRHGAARLSFATPAASRLAIGRLREAYDEVVAARTVSAATATRLYQDVPSDEEIHRCMSQAWDAQMRASD